MTITTTKTLFEGKGITKYFGVYSGLIFAKARGWIRAVDGVDLHINKGETFGLVGESGCGKTTLSRVILLIESATAGSLFFKGQDVFSLRGKLLTQYRRSVGAVFQDPFSSLNPRMRVGDIISEPMLATKLPREYIRERVTEVLALVGLPPANASLFPHEFSGGQRQRIAVARALSTNPEFIVLDEPVSALDVSIRAQTMNILREIQEQLGLTYLIIAHDLAVVRYMSNRIGVMYVGKIVESAHSEELYTNALHPYTKALLASALPTRPGEVGEEAELLGEIASPLNPPPGCRFHPRCTFRMPICQEEEPPMREETNGHKVACHLYRS